MLHTDRYRVESSDVLIDKHFQPQKTYKSNR